MECAKIVQGEKLYPETLCRFLRDRAPRSITVIGNTEILDTQPLGLFCSIKCPASLILQTYDLGQRLRETGTPVISGFHSPVERECLTTLLRGNNPIIVCLARGIERMRIPKKYSEPLDNGRLLLLSSFSENLRRSTKEMAGERNALVAAMADEILVAYAEPAGQTEALCSDIVAWRKPLYCFEDSANANLFALGGRSVTKSRLFS
jgi:predicted Rossmann fold nucleotide-binding protein DprA/Smf involved in DNA uptake